MVRKKDEGITQGTCQWWQEIKVLFNLKVSREFCFQLIFRVATTARTPTLALIQKTKIIHEVQEPIWINSWIRDNTSYYDK